MKKIFPRVAGIFMAFGFVIGVSAQNNTFTNPVYNYDSPDPSIQRGQDGTFYCYATNCQTRKSKDLVTSLPSMTAKRKNASSPKANSAENLSK